MENDENKMQEEMVDTATTDNQSELDVEEKSTTPDTQEQKISNFTQEQVNDIVRERITKERTRILNRYGVQSKDELDALVSRAKSYDTMLERYNTMANDYSTTMQENAFLKNNINPERYDDIRAYFKGKGIEFNPDNLLAEMSTHPEWENQVVNEEPKPVTTIERLGNQPQELVPTLSERQKALDYFGIRKK